MDLTVDLGFDPFAFATALIALWFVYHETKRNNRVVLRVESVRSSYPQSVYENGSEMFSELLVRVRNLGITLHSPSLVLEFREPNGFSWCRKPLKPKENQAGANGQFARGMIAEFTLKSYQLDDGDIRFLRLLKDPSKQNAYLCVYSQGYFARRFRIGGWWDWLKGYWNVFALWFNGLFERQVGTDSRGVDVISAPKILPRLVTLDFHIKDFVGSLTQQQDPAVSGTQWRRASEERSASAAEARR